MNAPASIEDPNPFGDAVLVDLRRVQRALRTLRITEEPEGATRELSRLLLDVLYPLVDLAVEHQREELFADVTTAAAAVATLCDFERLRPAELTATQIGRIVDERDKYWSAADQRLQALLHDLGA